MSNVESNPPLTPAQIVELAERGEAPGQCPECKNYRIDGQPPYLHVRGCSLTPSFDESFDRWVREGHGESDD